MRWRAALLIATNGYAVPNVEFTYHAARNLCDRLDRPADLFRRCAPLSLSWIFGVNWLLNIFCSGHLSLLRMGAGTDVVGA
jgi:hypothetical protein